MLLPTLGAFLSRVRAPLYNDEKLSAYFRSHENQPLPTPSTLLDDERRRDASRRDARGNNERPFRRAKYFSAWILLMIRIPESQRCRRRSSRLSLLNLHKRFVSRPKMSSNFPSHLANRSWCRRATKHFKLPCFLFSPLLMDPNAAVYTRIINSRGTLREDTFELAWFALLDQLPGNATAQCNQTKPATCYYRPNYARHRLH